MDNNITFDFEDIQYRYIVGVDLGTTNSAVAFVDRTAKETERRRIRFVDIPQLVSAGEVARRSVLPSFLYLPGPYELAPESIALPWDTTRNYAVGEFAREQGALVPGRLVTSAKSWLSHGGVDRTAPILPWGAGQDVNKVSPVEAGARYLQHIRESWNEMIARGREGYRLEEQLIILTVPASFDEVARELTVTAAQKAGLPRVILVEEPLAAFYAWLSRNEDSWQSHMESGQLILVCDVGGGTTDFTIVAVREGEKGLRFDRLAVGEHLMLGGDNMDLTLARHLEMQMVGKPGQIDSKRWHQLSHQCRKAKETLLGASQKREKIDVSIMGPGSRLIAGAMKGSLTFEKVKELILEGFFPFVPLDDASSPGGRRTGLTEWGLPYVQDPAVTRHLASFWQRFRALIEQETGRTAPYPDFILFNGGALTPSTIRNRILDVVKQWFKHEAGEDWMPRELENPRPELSVAIGASYYGLVRLGEGVRIGAGSPRAYYVGVGMEPAVESGAEQEENVDQEPHRAVCLIPRGTEEGFESQLNEPSFEVLTNQPVAFQLYSSSTRLGDRLGEIVTLPGEEITILPPIRTVLRYGRKGAATALPIRLGIRLTEVGTLELWCRSQQSPHRWQLQFDVRQGLESSDTLPPPPVSSGEILDQTLIEQVQERIRVVFHPGTSSVNASPERLTKEIISSLDLAKEKWPSSLIRKLADTLIECRQGRSITPQHESRWLNLLGFCLRPGFGDPVDEWRIREVWKIFPQGLAFPRQSQCRLEWWVFWRRIAGGLSSGQQLHIYQQVSSSLPVSEKKKKGAKKTGKKLTSQEETEVWMMLANFERLPVDLKVELGRSLLERMERGKPKAQELWALSRLGARMLFYGSLDRVIPGKETSFWVNSLLNMNLEASEGLAHALVQLALRTGDRERDLPQPDRDRLSAWLEGKSRAARFQEILNNPETKLRGQEQDWIFGEALPSGLMLSQPNP
jgi:hypothetical protein